MYNKFLVVIVIFETKVKDHWLYKAHPNLFNNELVLSYFDNSKAAQNIDSSEKTLYFHNEKNMGVSSCFNRGFELADHLKKEYVLLLDQDTWFEPAAFHELVCLIKKYGKNYIYAPLVQGTRLYSPFIQKLGLAKIITKNQVSCGIPIEFKKECIINSGAIISLQIYNKIGGFNESIKLDFSDIMFFRKCKKNHIFFIIADVCFYHDLSGSKRQEANEAIHRFKYYCNGARESVKCGEKDLAFPVFRRVVLLVLRYRSIRPLLILKSYFFGDKTI